MKKYQIELISQNKNFAGIGWFQASKLINQELTNKGRIRVLK